MDDLLRAKAAHLQSFLEDFPVGLICPHHIPADDTGRVQVLVPHAFLHIGKAVVADHIDGHPAFFKELCRIGKCRRIHPKPLAKPVQLLKILFEMYFPGTLLQCPVHNLILCDIAVLITDGFKILDQLPPVGQHCLHTFHITVSVTPLQHLHAVRAALLNDSARVIQKYCLYHLSVSCLS